jgi:Phage antirepressor protein KilAC domain./BRO family, N-terminal domain.
MKELILIKSDDFGPVKCDFWQDNNNNILMTREQIGRALGYSDPHRAIYKIHERNKDRLDKFSVVTKLTTTDGKAYETYLYTAKGVYEICRFSRQPKADAFMDWVWDVVESIRKHGIYATPKTIEDMLNDPDTMIKTLQALKKEREEKQKLQQQIERDKPKVLFADAVSTSNNSILVGELAKLLRQNGIDIGQNRLFRWLRANNYLGKSGENYNLPTQYSMDLGLFEIKKTVINNPDGSQRVTRTPKVTGKGQIYFINKFLSMNMKNKHKKRLNKPNYHIPIIPRWCNRGKGE